MESNIFYVLKGLLNVTQSVEIAEILRGFNKSHDFSSCAWMDKNLIDLPCQTWSKNVM